MERWGIFAIAALLAFEAQALDADALVHDQAEMNLSLYAQEQSEWCWAATTQTIAKHFGHLKPQCRMASRFVKKQPGDYCCEAGKAASRECNRAGALSQVLGHYQLLDRRITSPLATTAIITELKKHYPVAVRIVWDDGGGHFLIVYGASRKRHFGASIDTMNVWNPLPIGRGDRSVINRAALVRYRGIGNWTDSYTTRNPS